LFARTQRVAEVGYHRVDVQGGFDVMRIWTEVNGEILEAEYPTERLALQYALLIVRNENREAYTLALKYIVTVVVSFSRRVKGAFLQASHAPARVRVSDSS
jgi:hypothetical protein